MSVRSTVRVGSWVVVSMVMRMMSMMMMMMISWGRESTFLQLLRRVTGSIEGLHLRWTSLLDCGWTGTACSGNSGRGSGKRELIRFDLRVKGNDDLRMNL
jgi:hypothetical protein